MAVLQDNLSVFGTIKMVVPPTDKAVIQLACSDIWIFLLQSGVKLKFNGASQQLSQIEVYLVCS